MNIKITKSSLLITLIGTGLFTIFSIAVGCNTWLYLSVLLFIFLLTYCMRDFTNNLFFVFFLLSFFTFLMSGQITHDFFGYPMQYVVDDVDFNYLNGCIFISLFSLALGYWLAGFFSPRAEGQNHLSTPTRIREIRKVSKIVFYFFSIAWFAILAEQALVVQRGRYVDLYTYSSRLPGIVDQLSEACPIMLFIFLATYPDKKEARVPLFFLALYAGLSLLIGRRIYFVTYTILIIVYLLIRTYGVDNTSGEIWIQRKQIFILVLAAPLVLVLLYSYRYTRYGKAVEANSFFRALIGFFSQQGFSANLIVAGKRYEAILSDRLYSFLSFSRFFRRNIITSTILGTSSTASGSSVTSSALNSTSFANAISYILIPGMYQQGFGLGSCYIAELYHDFGYVGVALGNLLYGIIMRRFSKLNQHTFSRNVVTLLLFSYLLTVPRYNYDRPLAVFISLNFWACIIIVNLGASLIHKKKRRKLATQTLEL